MSFFEAETAQVKCKWAVSWQQKRLKTECPRYDYCEDFIIVEFSSRVKIVFAMLESFFVLIGCVSVPDIRECLIHEHYGIAPFYSRMICKIKI